MSIRIQKRGSSVVHAGHRTGGILVSECGAGEQYNGLNRQKPWRLLSETCEVTCKRCLKKLAESQPEPVRHVTAEIDRTEPGKALAYIGDRQAWLSREDKRWRLVDDYTDQIITVTGSTLSFVVRKWGDNLGVDVARIEVEKEY